MSSSSSNGNRIRISRSISSDFSGRSQHIFLILVAFRIFNALTLRTFFQPDEYYQSLEPAWHLAFGPESGAWLTWVPLPQWDLAARRHANPSVSQEWKKQLRSSLHPILFASVYRAAAVAATVSNVSAVTRTALLLATPRVAQALFAACLDYCTWSLARRLYGAESKCAQISVSKMCSKPYSKYSSDKFHANASLVFRLAACIDRAEPVELVLLHAYTIKLPRDYTDVHRTLPLALAMDGRA